MEELNKNTELNDRVDWYIKIAKIKYADKTADEKLKMEMRV